MKAALFASILICAHMGTAQAQLVSTPNAGPKLAPAPAQKTLAEAIREKERETPKEPRQPVPADAKPLTEVIKSKEASAALKQAPAVEQKKAAVAPSPAAAKPKVN